ncbi:sugar phosphate nucleotidyltransferase [Acetivibrio clariflavus]|uniref:Nucleoside-diphosphate-sugar pyrophosphorylase family protein n=1 Tax=Acetivibrio clariflavus (strain DSM 19732 / NBRC 101661 / EBR45) TaxID=720554 RepID=G8M376_ACECE|nr:sugar phosphate nucleotidyltransferase [Acetivibrio clariflavus]AEV70396.1 Nucleoside-diphosphate-sugar pyrophosphorylase family protein [Acetivibrio clariflavus DSM 19732]HOQ01704.1 sugar phosphate nucleotidyltransferase [Acetivibrio clariflavus]HPU40840.1 sugar phosphate nucleotidyltransferase [Acetivibrio clariflavus]
MQAVILAGGQGTRLRPFTTCIPKPLMPIDDMPILEVIMRQLKYFGIKNIIVSLNHLADLMMAFLQRGEKLGLNISYVIEDKALGTAGPLSIIDNLEETFLVMNADLLTTIDFGNLIDFHKQNGFDATISTYRKEVNISLGVVKSSDNNFVDYIEKPTYKFDVSMGIYVFNKSIVKYIPKNEKMDIPDLILKLKENNKRIGCYRADYDWLDIGKFDDYEKAVNVFREKRSEFLRNG